MAETVSATFRQNCYDDTKAQRLVLASDGITLSNEDISANSKVRFNLASCTSTQQIQFGCVPTNSVSVSILNEDGRFSSDSIVGKEFRCHIGVEVDDADYLAPKNAISALDTGSMIISVHSEAPYIRGNVMLASVLPELMDGYPCKIMLTYDALYFVVDDGTDRYYAKHECTGTRTFGEYDDPSDDECAMLDRLMDDGYDAIAYYDGGMAEFTYKGESVAPGEWHTVSGSVISVTDAIEYPMKSWKVGIAMTPSATGASGGDVAETWSEMKNKTWGTAKNKTWGDYSGYSIFGCVRYESVPCGVWHFDRPRKINTAVLTLTGKDRMVLFDEDSAQFVASVPKGVTLTPRTLIQAIGAYKGISVGDLSSLNELADEIRIDGKVYYQNKSLKDLLSYAFEVGGANGMIDRRGRLCASSSDTTAIALPYVYTFDVADYTAHTIGKMLVYRQGETSEYETDSSVTNGETYDWNDNPFFNNILLSGSWFSENIHKKYGGFRNAITVTDADYSMWCDDVYSWTDEDEVTYTEPIFTMQIEWGGSGRVTYTNYGDENRQYASYASRVEGTSNTNDQNLQGFNKAQYANRLFFDEQGLTVQSNGLRVINQNDEAVFYADDEGNLTLKGTVNANNGNIGGWQITEDGLEWVGNNGNVVKMLTNVYSSFLVENDVWGTRMYADGFDFVDKINGGGGAIQFDVDEDYRNLTIRCLGGSGVSASVDIEANSIGMYPSNGNIYFYDLSSTTNSANACFVNSKLCKSSSLRKLKDNIKTIEDASEKVDNLRGVSFTSKCEADDPNVVLYGLIAEEVEKAVPELATYEDGKLQGVQYDRVCALLIEDNKACHRRIEELEKRLEQLERRLDK